MRTRYLAVGAIEILRMLSADAGFAESLQWMFAADEVIETHVELVMRLKLDGPSGPLATEAREVMEMTWRVQNVKLTGDSVLVGKCDRVQARLAGENGEVLQFDSSADEPAMLISPETASIARSPATPTASIEPEMVLARTVPPRPMRAIDPLVTSATARARRPEATMSPATTVILAATSGGTATITSAV